MRHRIVVLMWMLGLGVLLSQTGTDSAWDFRKGFQGWKTANFKECKATPQGIEGTTLYDCCLMSPPLALKASDYNRAVVRVSTTIGGSCDLFIEKEGQPFSDKRKATVFLPASEKCQLLVFRLEKGIGWEGVIKRLRFDPVNPADAVVRLESIALFRQEDSMLFNGDFEMCDDKAPLGWTLLDGAELCHVQGEVANGVHCLDLKMAGANAFCPFADVSWLGTFGVSFKSKGNPCRATVEFFDRHGAVCGAQSLETTASDAWSEATGVFAAPDMAYTGRLAFASVMGDSKVDCVRVWQRTKGVIKEAPIVRPRWCGQWIWCSDNATADNCTAWIRKAFVLPDKPVRSACIQVACDDTFALYVNGQGVFQNHGEIDAWKRPVVLDLKPYLRCGENVVMAEARDVSDAQGFLANVAIDVDGSFVTLNTDSSWEAATTRGGPWKTPCLKGEPPCQPWYDLPYRAMGTMPSLTATLGKLKEKVKPGEELDVNVEFKPFTFDGPVGLKAELTMDGKALSEAWALDGVKGEHVRVSLFVPYSAKEGAAQVSVTLDGAVLSSPVVAPVAIEKHGEGTQPKSDYPSTRIVTANNVSWISVNGVLLDPTHGLYSGFDSLHARNAKAAKLNLMDIQVKEFGFYKDGFNYDALDRMLHDYLAVNPDAWFFFNFNVSGIHHHAWWLEDHPEARCCHEDGTDTIGAYSGAKGFMPSYSSPVWREAFGNAVRQMLRHLKNTPYASRVIGMHPSCGISSEWFHWGSQSGEFVDYSDCGKLAFRKWLKEKYGTTAALCQAWNRTDITLDNAPIPSEKSRKSPGAGLFYDVKTQQDVLDYHAFQHFSVVDTIRYFAKIIKEETDGNCLVGTYYGYTCHIFENVHFGQNSGHFNARALLDDGDFDFFMAPTAYTQRFVGGCSGTMLPTRSSTLNGKLFWSQADLRTHWSPQRHHGNVETIRGDVECMHRELARNLAEGNGIQWFDFSHGWTMGDRRLTDVIRQHGEIISRYRGTVRDFEKKDYLLVVIDEGVMGTFDVENPPYRGALVYQQLLQLAYSGIPWRSVLFSDLFKHRDKLLEYKAMLFLTPFRLTDEEASFLKTDVLTHGRFVGFMGPVGIFDKDGLTTRHASFLMEQDFHIEEKPLSVQGVLKDKWPDLKGRKFGPPANYVFGSVMLPDKLPSSILVAELAANGAPAAFYKETPTCNIFWSACPGLQAELLRELAKAAGVPVVSDANDAIFAGSGFIGIHAASEGQKAIRLIGKGRPRELLYNQTWPEGTGIIQTYLKKGDTRIFIME